MDVSGICPIVEQTNSRIGKLKLTPLRRASLPPPMALHEIELARNIKDVAINFANTRIATLHETTITVLIYDVKVSPVIDPVVERTIALPISNTVIARQICFRSDVDLFVLAMHLASGVDMIYDVQKSSFHSPSATMSIFGIFPTLDHDALCVTNSTAVSRVNLLEPTEGKQYGTLMSKNICSFPTSTSWVEVLNYAGQVSS